MDTETKQEPPPYAVNQQFSVPMSPTMGMGMPGMQMPMMQQPGMMMPGMPGMMPQMGMPGMMPGQQPAVNIQMGAMGGMPQMPMVMPGYAAPSFSSTAQIVNVQPGMQYRPLSQQITGATSDGIAVSGAIDANAFLGSSVMKANAKAQEEVTLIHATVNQKAVNANIALQNEAQRLQKESRIIDVAADTALQKQQMEQQKLQMQQNLMAARAAQQDHMLNLAVNSSQEMFSTQGLADLDKQIKKVDDDIVKQKRKLEENKSCVKIAGCCDILAQVLCFGTLGICNCTREPCCKRAREKRQDTKRELKYLEDRQVELIEKREKVRQAQAHATGNFTTAMFNATPGMNGTLARMNEF